MQFIDALERRQLFAGGALDVSFGSSGTSRVAFKVAAHQEADILKVVSDTGGRTYVVAVTGGYQNNQSARTSLQIRRLDAAGALDGSWATAKAGTLAFPLSDAQQPYQSIPQYDVVVDSANRLDVMIGTMIYRFKTNGTLDASFGKKGMATLGDMTNVSMMTLDSAGHIYVIGTNATSSTTSVATLDRLTADGAADTSFQSNGNYRVPAFAPKKSTGATSFGVAVRVLADQSIMVVSEASYNTTSDGEQSQHIGTESIKLTSKAKVDTTYGNSGIATDFGTQQAQDYEFDSIEPAAIRSDGSVIMDHHGGDQETSFGHNEVIASNGKSIATKNFGTNAVSVEITQTDKYGNTNIIRQADGTELVQSNYSLFKINAAGDYDTTFNGGTPISGVATAALQYDGTVVTAGQGNDRFSVYVKRYFRDDGPAAMLAAKPLTAASASFKFSVVYRDPDGINASTIIGAELRIVAPDGSTHKVRLIGTSGLTDDNANVIGTVATYRVVGPTGGAWTKADNGSYGVRILANYVKDMTGTAIITQRTLGYLTVAIA